MKKVAIIGLGWLGMALTARGWQVTGSKTTPDGVEAARRCGIEAVQLQLTPEIACDVEDLATLLDTDALVVTLSASRTAEGGDSYMQAVQSVVDSALANQVPHIIFTSSTSVYGGGSGVMTERSALQPETVAGKTLAELESWLHDLLGTQVDILRLAGLVGPSRHPGRFLAGKSGLTNAAHTASTWCIWMTWSALSCCCCSRRQAGASSTSASHSIRGTGGLLPRRVAPAGPDVAHLCPVRSGGNGQADRRFAHLRRAGLHLPLRRPGENATGVISAF
ncbi:NAD(P)-dependent oxidoreductase|nr:NAD(P)-dependent oxidoreductase [Candidatus Pantoea persica]